MHSTGQLSRLLVSDPGNSYMDPGPTRPPPILFRHRLRALVAGFGTWYIHVHTCICSLRRRLPHSNAMTGSEIFARGICMCLLSTSYVQGAVMAFKKFT